MKDESLYKTFLSENGGEMILYFNKYLEAYNEYMLLIIKSNNRHLLTPEKNILFKKVRLIRNILLLLYERNKIYNKNIYYIELYYDIISDISLLFNISVPNLPLGRFYKTMAEYKIFDVGAPVIFNSYEEWKKEVENKEVVVYEFYLTENKQFVVRYDVIK
jgi:hypothetical protein